MLVSLVLIMLHILFPPPLFAQEDSREIWARVQKEIQAQKYSEAEQGLKKLVSMEPQKGLYWFNLGQIQLLKTDYSSAAKSFSRVIKVGSPLTPYAQIYLVKSLRLRGHLEDAYKRMMEYKGLESIESPGLLTELKNEKEQLGEKLFAVGMDRFEAEQFRQALPFFVRSYKVMRDSQSLVMLALCHQRLGSNEKARRYLRRAKKMDNKGEISALAKLIEEVETHPLRLQRSTFYIGLAGLYNSNVARGPDQGDSESDSGIRLWMTLPLRSKSYGDWLWNNRFTFWSEEYLQVREESYYDASYATSFVRKWNDFYFDVGTGVSQEFYDHQIYRLIPKINFDFKFHNTRFDWGLFSQIEKVIVQNEEYDYLDGQIMTFFPYFNWNLKRRMIGVWGYYQIQDSEDYVVEGARLPLAGSTFGLGIKWNEFWQADLASELGLAWSMSQFDQNFLPGNDEREDQQLKASLKVKRQFLPSLAGLISFEMLQNTSTMNEDEVFDKNYSQNLIWIGGEWAIGL